MNIRNLIYDNLHETKKTSAKLVDFIIFVFNILFCILFVAETYADSMTGLEKKLVFGAEIFLFCFLLAELILRIYSAKNRLAYILSFQNIIDAVALLPTVIIVILQLLSVRYNDYELIKIIKILKVLRILRFLRYTLDPNFFFGTIRIESLRIMRLILIIILIFFINSGLFFYFEKGLNPKVLTFFDAFYYSVVTLTTVGFGDITPATPRGKLVTVLMILSGIILVPYQISLILTEWAKVKKKFVICPQCGLRYHDPDASHCKACGKVIYQEYDGH